MDGKTMVSNFKNWVVVGDVNNNKKYAYRILEKFKEKNYNVAGVNPKGGNEVYLRLKDVPFKIECIDLCINPKVGLEIIKEAKELGIKNILIQPGAESDEIISYCKENDLEAIENCALVQLNRI
ncbi:CoA-binding protein [Clostridium fallax]|uniref:Predicted CoA-binding protein n=1 Tax=Clostridium fallax TaxID=1533 RepID=A0A1M4SJD2_9CLOT|nr:CoA-binding protein [Clostridium fallax]SHE32296.1 Predicted CoA-binding protein [Clostridium fallax]SQB07855.1 putative CoA-binding protein [Clostridium fallax]